MLTRRSFLGSGFAFAALPPFAGGLPAASAAASAWEEPGGTATASVLNRRLFLDVCGRIPTEEEARKGIPDGVSARLATWFAAGAYVDYWTMRFADALRVKSEFPINLWPNAVYVYHRRIREFVAADEPWTHFARALLLSGGSDFRDAEANFFRAMAMRTPDGRVEAISQTFFYRPAADLPESLRTRIRDAFANIAFAGTREWKEEIVYCDGPDRRRPFADWLTEGEGRELLAEGFVRRLTDWVFGPDDAAGRATLSAQAAIADGFRLQPLLARIFGSAAYRRGSVTGGFPVRRLDAEVLEDALCSIAGLTRSYSSIAPEPFTFLPPERPTIDIEDGSITSSFLLLFGRPPRDTGLPSERLQDVTAAQRLHLFNGQRLNAGLQRAISRFPKKTGVESRLRALYWRTLGRAPSAPEMRTLRAARKARRDDWRFVRDVAWCLVNTREFLYRI